MLHNSPSLGSELLAKVLVPSLKLLREQFVSEGFELKFVGGVVRDLLCNKTPKDVDLCTDASPEYQIKIYEKYGYQYYLTGESHGTISVMLDDVLYEITTLRTESNHDGRHAEVTWTSDWHADCLRRDFTFNSMNLDFDGNLFDPFNGREDLFNGIVRFVGNADDRINEDFLRIIRFFRFYQRFGKDFEPEMLYAISRNACGLKKISGERIWAEFSKILIGDNVSTILEKIKETGICEFIDFNFCVSQFTNELVYISQDPVTVLAQILSQNNAHKLNTRWKLSSLDFSKLQFLIKFKGACISLKDYQDLIVKGNSVNFIMQLAYLDSETNIAKELSSWNIPVFPVTGDDLLSLGYTPGIKLGTVLKELKTLWMQSNFLLTKEELLKDRQ